MPNKMQHFSQQARRALSFAQETAERLHHRYIGTEHLLLGLIHDEEGVAGRTLHELRIEQSHVEDLVRTFTSASREPSVPLDLSPDTKRALEQAVSEARGLGHDEIGTEHLLLGLVSQPDAALVNLFQQLGTSADEIRGAVFRIMQTPPAPIEIPSEQAAPLLFSMLEKMFSEWPTDGLNLRITLNNSPTSALEISLEDALPQLLKVLEAASNGVTGSVTAGDGYRIEIVRKDEGE